MSIKGIKYYSMLEPSGYGLSAISYLNALITMGCPVHWVPLVLAETGYRPWYQLPEAQLQVRKILRECVPGGDQIDRLIDHLEPIEDYQGIVMHVVPEYWPYLKEENQYHIGYTVWETSRLPRHFPDLINQVDRVLVPSTFNKPIFERSGVDIPVYVVPHIFDLTVCQSEGSIRAMRRLIAGQPDNFIFYSINTWTARKAPWTLIHTYLRTFTRDDPVSLVLKTSACGPRNGEDRTEHCTQELVAEIASDYPKPAHIKVLSHKFTQDEIAALHQVGDCFVSTSHSEGWGMGMFEAAGMANPVIATAWGGQLDFLTAESSYLTPYELIPVVDKRGESSYSSDQLWAEPDTHELSKQFRKIYQAPTVARHKAAKLATSLHKKYNPVQIGQHFHQAIYDE